MNDRDLSGGGWLDRRARFQHRRSFVNLLIFLIHDAQFTTSTFTVAIMAHAQLQASYRHPRGALTINMGEIEGASEKIGTVCVRCVIVRAQTINNG